MSEAPCILIVDDEVANRDLLEALLAPEGYRLAHAAHGQEALDRVAAGGIDLVLLDVLMPGVDGIETCRRIREDLGERMLPVVMVTALADRTMRAQSKRWGADDFLVKPVFEDELLARVRNLLLRSEYYREAARERARAEAEAKRWKLVSDVARVVSVCTDYETLQLSIRELLKPHLPVDAFLFLEFHGDELRFPAAAPGARPGVLDRLSRIKLSSAPWLTILQERPMLAAHECADELKPILRATGRSRPAHGAVLPLHAGGFLNGLLVLFAARPLTADELLLTEELSPHLTNAVTNVRSHLKAKELNDARDRLSMLLVHDLKNPLSVISMNLEMLAPHVADDCDRREMVRDSSLAAERMLQMIMDLLDIGRAEEGKLALRRSTLSVQEVVNETCTRFSKTADRHGIDLNNHVEQGLSVDADRGLVMRTLENLVCNALRYAPTGGAIEVRAHADNAQLVLTVRNDGPALAADARDRLFEKYGSSEHTRTTPNRGLGLYFCRLVAEAHGGGIRAYEPADGGVAFEIRLPRLLARRAVSLRVARAMSAPV